MKKTYRTTILMTADGMGGVWTYAFELCKGLASYDVHVVLATMGDMLKTDQRRKIMSLPNVELFESQFKLEWMQNPWVDTIKAGKWLLELQHYANPDVIHLNGYVHAALPWSAPVMIVSHSCVLSWWNAVKGEPAPASWDKYSSAVRNGLDAADLIVSPTRAMLSCLEREYGPLNPSMVIPNGLTPAHQKSKKDNFVLAVGRIWDEAKNIRALENAGGTLSWPVYVAGEPIHPENGLTEWKNVTLLGQLPSHELSDWFGMASIYALPARYEPFGYTPLEAASAQCALVLGDIPSLREVWGDSAVFVKPDDVRELSTRVNNLISDISLRERMAQQAFNKAKEYTSEKMVNAYADVYQNLDN